MDLHIKLNNSGTCNFCPVLHLDVDSTGRIREAVCGLKDKQDLRSLKITQFDDIVRPDWCIRENGA